MTKRQRDRLERGERSARRVREVIAQRHPARVDCPDCEGRGHHGNGRECARCAGTGRIPGG